MDAGHVLNECQASGKLRNGGCEAYNRRLGYVRDTGTSDYQYVWSRAATAVGFMNRANGEIPRHQLALTCEGEQ